MFVAVLLVIPSIHAQAKPDIYIADTDVSPVDIYAGDQVKVKVTVGNLGAGAHNVGVALFVDNRTAAVDEIEIDVLDEGSEEEVTLYWFAEEGEHTLFIFADPDGKIDEDNEDNNFVSVEVTVQKPIYPPFPPAAENATWWDSTWHYRVPLTASMVGEREDYAFANKMVYCTINFTELMDILSYYQAGSFSKRTFYPDSVRVVEYELHNGTWVPVKNVGREIILNNDYDALENANVTVMWVMEGNVNPHERRYYYIYWDTVENGHKRGEFARIHSGIKNAEFEDTTSTQWKNVTEGAIKWESGYVDDPVEEDTCYGISAKGLFGIGGYIWSPGYVKIRQDVKVPDEGEGYYVLHGKVFAVSDVESFQWQILVDGTAIETGYSTGGWLIIQENITSYLKSKGTVTISFKVEVTTASVTTEQQEISAYIDSFWIETAPITTEMFANSSRGWWGDASGLDTTYVSGAEGKDTIERIDVESIAYPKEVMAKLYSPKSELIKASMPLPDPSFEEEGYTYLFANDEKTTSSRIQETLRHGGNRAVELRMSNYLGTWEFQNEDVAKGAVAGFRQNITHGITLAELPELYFWYNIERFSSSAVLNYTILTVGSTPKFYTIPLSILQNDNQWHRYDIPAGTLHNWRQSGGKITAIEMRLIADEESTESTVYIDDLGYSFMPENATDRTKWHIEDFYTFVGGTKTGKWRVDVILADGSDYRVEKSIQINVDAAANLDVYNVEVPASLKEGETGIFTVQVKNHGPKAIGEDTPINITLAIYQEDGDYIKMRQSVAGLAVDEVKTVTFQWTALYGKEEDEGNWKIIARVNENGEIAEWEMKDNWYASEVNVEPRPDVKIDMEDVLFVPGHPQQNETINISIIVHNIGYANASARIKIYKRGVDEDKFVLIGDGSIEKFIEGKSKARVVHTWMADNGTYHIKVEVSCDDEINTGNNVVIKDIRVGGGMDFTPPVIESVRIEPEIQVMGQIVNISATISDENTTIERATITVSNGTQETEHTMRRVGTTDIYYATISSSKVGYYTVVIQAWDTSVLQNMAETEEASFRVVYEGIETDPPVIKAVSIDPPEAKQVVSGTVNISAYIEDESGIERAVVVISDGTTEETHEMDGGENHIYYYEKECDTPGTFSYYIDVVDASANANHNRSATHSFEVPSDYDMDGVPDTVELSAGSDPKNESDVINVSVGGEEGYLLWVAGNHTYRYWDRDDDEIRTVTEKDVDGDGQEDVLFDADGDGRADYYYNEAAKELRVYEEQPEEEPTETVWILPPLALFILVCIGFIAVRKR